MLVVKGFSKNAVWVDFRNYRKANCSNVMYFVNQCKKIYKILKEKHDQLYKEIIDLKTISDSQIAPNQAILKEYDNGTKEYCMDITWHQLQELKSSAGCSYRFRQLFKIVTTILVTAHSNAGSECVYSIFKKSKSDLM